MYGIILAARAETLALISLRALARWLKFNLMGLNAKRWKDGRMETLDTKESTIRVYINLTLLYRGE